MNLSDSVFSVVHQKAKSSRGFKASRIASLRSSECVTGQLYQQSVLVHAETCSKVSHKGECYGRCVLEEDVLEQLDINYKTNSPQGTSERTSSVEADSTTMFDVTKLNEQVQYLKSCIHLCLEEAFYLVQCKHSLSVYMDDSDTVLTQEDLWKECCKRVKNFVYKYVVYQYYRDKGWVPKLGTKFGVHFLLYKDGPAYYHSSYGVVIRSVMSALEMTWQFVVSYVRTMESVKKGAIICETKIQQDEINSVDLLNPSCISKFVVEETLVHRWVPKQDRS